MSKQQKIIVKIKLEKDVQVPEYKTEFASGADIRANNRKKYRNQTKSNKENTYGLYF